MKSLKELNKELEEANVVVESISEQIKERKSQTIVMCEHNHYYGKGCGQGFKIKDLEYIQTHWYESPYGCTGGDNWHQGEGQWQCPVCEHRNRLYNKPDITEMKYLFGSIVKEHDR